MNDVIVVGSADSRERIVETDLIARTLQGRGYDVERCRRYWPRNHWVYDSEKHITQKERGWLGDGGQIILADKFVLVSDLRDYPSPRPSLPEIYSTASVSSEISLLKKIYAKPAIFVPYTREYHGIFIRDIDMSCLVIDSRKTLIVDKTLLLKMHPESFIKEIFEPLNDYKYNLIMHDSGGADEKEYFPCNCFIDGEFVLSTSCAPKFIKLLKSLDLDIEAIPIQHLQHCQGSIRCSTNKKSKDVPLEELFDEMEEYPFQGS